jgi:hypothetical protein
MCSQACAKGFGAFGAGADAAEVVVAEDSGGVAIGEGDLDGVITDCGGGLRARLGFEHWQGCCGGRPSGGESGFSDAFVVAGGAGTLFAEIGKIVMTGMAVGPGDVDAGAGRYVDLYGGGFFAGVDGDGHG